MEMDCVLSYRVEKGNRGVLAESYKPAMRRADADAVYSFLKLGQLYQFGFTGRVLDRGVFEGETDDLTE